MTTIGIGLGMLGAVYLLGGRHNLRRYRETGSPSEGSAHFLHVVGVVFLVVSVLLIVSGLIPPLPTRAERLETAWSFKDGVLEDQKLAPRLWEDLPVTDNLTSPDRATEERPEPAVRYAVVGEDDDVIPEGAVPADARPHDLVVMTAAAPMCEPSRLVVEELPGEVRLTVVTVPGPLYQEAWQAALDEQEDRDQSLRNSLLLGGATSEEADSAMQRLHEESSNFPGRPPYIDPAVPPGCEMLGPPGYSAGPSEWRLIHVPLDRPLRARPLVDTSTGQDVPRVSNEHDERSRRRSGRG